MKARAVLLAPILLVVLADCALNRTNLIDTPFPGRIVAVSPGPGRCTPDGCPATYAVDVTNPTRQDANVLECHLDEGQDQIMGQLVIPVGTVPAGAAISSGATRRVTAFYYLPVLRPNIERLVGVTVTCQGVDWHGNPPI